MNNSEVNWAVLSAHTVVSRKTELEEKAAAGSPADNSWLWRLCPWLKGTSRLEVFGIDCLKLHHESPKGDRRIFHLMKAGKANRHDDGARRDLNPPPSRIQQGPFVWFAQGHSGGGRMEQLCQSWCRCQERALIALSKEAGGTDPSISCASRNKRFEILEGYVSFTFDWIDVVLQKRSDIKGHLVVLHLFCVANMDVL